MANIVYIATSIDGFIADRNNKLDWLEMVPNPEHKDMGFSDFIGRIDAIVMGRNTYETVVGFEGDWPYPKPVFVCSNTLKTVPQELQDKVFLINGSPEEITENLIKRGLQNLYIDGGKTIQNFLKADMIDEMIISQMPVLLGGGYPLFGELTDHKEFELVSSDVLLDQIVSTRYKRKK